jgi:RimJ/RimL family protein N-acetyltransferase
MNLSVTDFAVEHLLTFQPNETQESPESIAERSLGMLARSLVLDGDVVAAAGVLEKWPGVGEAWVWLDQDVVDHHAWSFARTVKYELLPIADKKFGRIWAPVDVGNEKAIRFIQWLEFELEFDTPLKRYGLDAKGDYWSYVRFN